MDEGAKHRGVVGRFLVAGAAAVLTSIVTTATTERAAGACSCGGPEPTLVAPDRVDDAPLDTKIRLELPSAGFSAGWAGGAPVLRTHDGEKVVVTTSRVIASGGWLDSVELKPASPLAPSTQYEIAVTYPSEVRRRP